MLIKNEPALDGDKSPIVVFDVSETLLDVHALSPVFGQVFGDSNAVRGWFDQVVIYSQALTLSNQYADGTTVGIAVLEMLAAARGRVVGPSDIAMLRQLSAALPTYPDTVEALQMLKQAGVRVMTLNNSPTAVVAIQLAGAGLSELIDEVHSIDDGVRLYKPAKESYLDLARALGVSPTALWLVSCHAFDTMGAAEAGFRTALILRSGNAPIGLGKAPDIVDRDLRTIVERILAQLPHKASGRC